MKIAIHSSDLVVIGNILEYESFYSLVKRDFLLDRLLRKYVRREDVEQTMDKLNRLTPSLKHINTLNKLVKAFASQSKLANSNLNDYGKYIPVRIVLFDEPYCSLSDNIPLEDYDNNHGEPFWMRPEYIIEKYGKDTLIRVDTMTPTSYDHKASYKNGKLVK